MVILFAIKLYNKFMKIYIAPSYLKRPLLNELSRDNAILFDTKIYSPKAYINEHISYDEDLYALKKKIEGLDLDDLKEAYKERSFLENVYRDRKLLDIYDIKDINILDDYKKILDIVDPYPKKELDDLLSNDHHDITIIDGDYDIFESYIIDHLYQSGAKSYRISTTDHHDTYYKLPSIKQAIDKIIEEIIQRDLPLKDCVIMADPSDYRLLDVHLHRSNITPHFIRPFKESYKAKAFISIIDLYEHFDVEHYLDLIDHNIFSINDQKALKLYLKDHLDTMTLDEFVTLKDQDRYYRELEVRANEGHKVYIPLLKSLKEASDLKEAIMIAFDTLKDDTNETKDIKRIIERYRDHLEDAYDLLESELKDLKVNDADEGIDIITYGMTYIRPKHLFILDPSTSKYPNFSDLKGFLSEEVIKDTAIPSLSERFKRHKKNFDIFDTSIDTTYVFIESTLDGKKVQYEPIFKVPKEGIPLVMTERELNYDKKLADPSIFFAGDILKGSVSSFESYFRCPYLYFLQRGIKLYAPKTKDLDAATTGTIFHAILEELVRRHHKEYPYASEDEIDDLILKHEKELLSLYPKRKEAIKAMSLKMKKGLLLELAFLKEFEATSNYKPYAFEEEIKDGKLLEGKISVHGFIDRIDKKDDTFRIIDYKTGDRTINKDSIARGTSLQLLTYAFLYALEKGLDVSMVLYIITKHNTLSFQSYSASKSKGLSHNELTEDDILKAFNDDHKAKGLVFEKKEDVSEDEMRYISKGQYGTGVWANKDKTSALLDDVYACLYEALKSGDISLTPRKDACKYCDFKRICHFKGIYDMRNDLLSDKEIKP